MKLYSIKKGKYYFKGSKFQPIIWPIAITIASLVLSIIFSNIIYFIISLAISSLFLLEAKKKTIVFSKRVYFSSSCLYRLNENYDQINKLFGFSEGYHHWNSARIGWRCTDGANIELLAYCYVDGVRISKTLLTCKPDTWVFCNIQNQDSKYIFKAFNSKDKLRTAVVEKNSKWSFYSLFKLFIYNLYPYFGGKIPAPRDMGIYMISLK